MGGERRAKRGDGSAIESLEEGGKLLLLLLLVGIALVKAGLGGERSEEGGAGDFGVVGGEEEGGEERDAAGEKSGGVSGRVDAMTCRSSGTWGPYSQALDQWKGDTPGVV